MVRPDSHAVGIDSFARGIDLDGCCMRRDDVLICCGEEHGNSYEERGDDEACTLRMAWQESTAPVFQHAGVQPASVEAPNASTASVDALTMRVSVPPVLSQALAASAHIPQVAASAATKPRSMSPVPTHASTALVHAPAVTSIAS